MKQLYIILILLQLISIAGVLKAQKKDLAEMEIQAQAWVDRTDKLPSDTLGLRLLNELVVMHLMRGQNLKALEIARSAVSFGEQMLATSSGKHLRNVRDRLCNSYSLLGSLLRQQMAYEEAAEVAHLLIVQSKLTGNNSFIASAYGNLARCYEQMGDLSTALPLRWKEMGYAKKATGIVMAEGHRRLGQVHASLRNMDSAAYHFKQGLLLNDSVQSPQKTLGILVDLVDLYAVLGDEEQMEHYAEKMNALGTRVPQGRDQQRIQLGKAKVHFVQGRYTSAISEIRNANNLYVDGQSSSFRSLKHQLLAMSLAAEHQNRAALLHMDSALVDFRNTLGLDKVRALARMQTEKKHEQEMQLAQAQLQVERTQKKLVMVLGISILSLTLLGWRLLRATRLRAKLLAAKNEQILAAQAQLITSEKQRESEQVRTRIARDIHDSIGGELTKIVMFGAELSSSIEKDHAKAMAIVERMRTQARSASSAINDVVWAADPEKDTISSLLKHLERHTRHMLDGSAIALRCEFDLSEADLVLSPLVKHNIFMVLKESLNNVLKYARPTMVEVALRWQGSKFALTVKDNGQGFDTGQLDQFNGNGLRNMRSRAQQIGARLEMFSMTGDGTLVTLSGTIEHS